MKFDILGIYLVDFKKNTGGEFSGLHYGVVLTSTNINEGKTFLIAPITSKKSGKKYRGGFTIDTTKYQMNPRYEKAFVLVSKIREVDKSRVYKDKIYTLDVDDEKKLKETFLKIFKFL